MLSNTVSVNRLISACWLIAALSFLANAAHAQAAEGFTNASLKGDYATVNIGDSATVNRVTGVIKNRRIEDASKLHGLSRNQRLHSIQHEEQNYHE